MNQPLMVDASLAPTGQNARLLLVEGAEPSVRLISSDEAPADQAPAPAGKNTDLLGRMLRADGYAVTLVRSVARAIQSLESDGAPDALIVDVTVPRLEYLELVRRARARAPFLPVILITSHPELTAAAAVEFFPSLLLFSKPLDYARFTLELGQVRRSLPVEPLAGGMASSKPHYFEDDRKVCPGT